MEGGKEKEEEEESRGAMVGSKIKSKQNNGVMRHRVGIAGNNKEE